MLCLNIPGYAAENIKSSTNLLKKATVHKSNSKENLFTSIHRHFGGWISITAWTSSLRKLTCVPTSHSRYLARISRYPNSQCSCVASSNVVRLRRRSPRANKTDAEVWTSPRDARCFNISTMIWLGSHSPSRSTAVTLRSEEGWSSAVTGWVSAMSIKGDILL